MKAEIEVSAMGTGRIVLDGRDVSNAVRGFRVTGDVGEVTRLELNLSVFDSVRFGAEVDRVHVPPATRDALITLGWTPPAE